MASADVLILKASSAHELALTGKAERDGYWSES
jgi:hypothetical protein